MLHESVCNFILGQKKDGPVNKRSPFVHILNITIDINSCVASQYQKLYQGQGSRFLYLSHNSYTGHN